MGFPELGKRERLLHLLRADRRQHFVLDKLCGSLSPARSAQLCIPVNGSRRVQAVLVGGQQSAYRVRTIFLGQVLNVQLALAVGEGAFFRAPRADETEVQVVELDELAGRHALEQLFVPFLRPGEALAHDGQALGEPVRHLEVGLFEIEHVGQFMRSTRAQLNGRAMPLPCGETIANIRPVEGPIVKRSGRAITRPLNMAWLSKTSMRIGPLGR